MLTIQLVDTQQQIESLVNELRLLRTHVILDSSTFGKDEDKEGQAASSQPKRPSRTVMGDARAEHLLLAAKKVRTMRQQDQTIGRLTLDELQRRGVVGPDGGLSYSEGYGGLPEEDELLPSDDDDKKPPTASPAYQRAGSSTKPSGTPLLPRPKKTKRNVPTTPSRARATTQQAPQTTPGGSNFNDLLLAAEMATRPGTPSRSVGASMSSARSTTTNNWEASSAAQSPSKKPRRQAPATIEWSTRRHVNKEGDGSPNREDAASALDLLAQASQDVSSSGGGLASAAARLEGAVEGDPRSRYRSHSSRSETPLGPAINLASSAGPTPSHFPPGADNPFVNSPNNNNQSLSAFQSPTGAAVPGLGKYVHLSSTVPARRVRSPYLKWTKEEVSLGVRV